jgi:5-methylcytosine-specific restriction protein A
MKLRALKPKLAPMRRKVEPVKRAEAIYLSPEWRDLVSRLIEKRGRRCEACGKTHETDGSPVRLIGDHIIERRDGGADLDETNVQLLCARAGGDGRPHGDGARGACHPRKTAAARRARLGRP